MESLASEFYTQHCWWIQAGQWSPNLNFLSRSGKERLLWGNSSYDSRLVNITLVFKANAFMVYVPENKRLQQNGHCSI